MVRLLLDDLPKAVDRFRIVPSAAMAIALASGRRSSDHLLGATCNVPQVEATMAAATLGPDRVIDCLATAEGEWRELIPGNLPVTQETASSSSLTERLVEKSEISSKPIRAAPCAAPSPSLSPGLWMPREKESCPTSAISRRHGSRHRATIANVQKRGIPALAAEMLSPYTRHFADVLSTPLLPGFSLEMAKIAGSSP